MKVLSNADEIRRSILEAGYGETHTVANPDLVYVGLNLADDLRPGHGNKFEVQACKEVDPKTFTRPTKTGNGFLSLVRTNDHPATPAVVTEKFEIHAV